MRAITFPLRAPTEGWLGEGQGEGGTSQSAEAYSYAADGKLLSSYYAPAYGGSSMAMSALAAPGASVAMAQAADAAVLASTAAESVALAARDHLLAGDDLTATDAAVTAENEPMAAAAAEGEDAQRNWNLEDVQRYLKAMSLSCYKTFFEKWFGEIVGGADAGAWFSGWPYLEVAEWRPNAYKSTPQKIVAHVDDDWTSMQVAAFIGKELDTNPEFTTLRDLGAKAGNPFYDVAVHGKLREDLFDGLVKIGNALEVGTTTVVSLIPGGGFALAAKDLFEGHPIRAALGALAALPVETVVQVAEGASCLVGMAFHFSGAGKPLNVMWTWLKKFVKLGKSEQTVIEEALERAGSTEEAEEILSRMLGETGLAGAKGVARERKVAELVGGTVSREIVVVPGLGRTDIDVIGKAGEIIGVGGPAKAQDLAKLGRQLQILKAIGEIRVKPVMYYFEEGTPQQAIDLARRWLGDANVVTYLK